MVDINLFKTQNDLKPYSNLLNQQRYLYFIISVKILITLKRVSKIIQKIEKYRYYEHEYSVKNNFLLITPNTFLYSIQEQNELKLISIIYEFDQWFQKNKKCKCDFIFKFTILTIRLLLTILNKKKFTISFKNILFGFFYHLY